MMNIPGGDSMKPRIMQDNSNDDDGSLEEPSINPPTIKKKKGITINEMLQNDLETDEEKLERYRLAQEQEQQRIAELVKQKNQGIDTSLMQTDEDDILRLNYQIKASEDSNEYNNLSYNQEMLSGNPYQNDLAMLDESYTGQNEGGFNGYNSMKKSDSNIMNGSRPSSSPRNNNLMRTYDSLAMTQQFNYGFNYNTSGGGAEVLSQNTTSVVEKIVDDESEKGITQFQSQKSYDMQTSQERIGEMGAEELQDQLIQIQEDVEKHKEIKHSEMKELIPLQKTHAELIESDKDIHRDPQQVDQPSVQSQIEEQKPSDQKDRLQHPTIKDHVDEQSFPEGKSDSNIIEDESIDQSKEFQEETKVEDSTEDQPNSHSAQQQILQETHSSELRIENHPVLVTEITFNEENNQETYDKSQLHRDTSKQSIELQKDIIKEDIKYLNSSAELQRSTHADENIQAPINDLPLAQLIEESHSPKSFDQHPIQLEDQKEQNDKEENPPDEQKSLDLLTEQHQQQPEEEKEAEKEELEEHLQYVPNQSSEEKETIAQEQEELFEHKYESSEEPLQQSNELINKLEESEDNQQEKEQLSQLKSELENTLDDYFQASQISKPEQEMSQEQYQEPIVVNDQVNEKSLTPQSEKSDLSENQIVQVDSMSPQNKNEPVDMSEQIKHEYSLPNEESLQEDQKIEDSTIHENLEDQSIIEQQQFPSSNNSPITEILEVRLKPTSEDEQENVLSKSVHEEEQEKQQFKSNNSEIKEAVQSMKQSKEAPVPDNFEDEEEENHEAEVSQLSEDLKDHAIDSEVQQQEKSESDELEPHQEEEQPELNETDVMHEEKSDLNSENEIGQSQVKTPHSRRRKTLSQNSENGEPIVSPNQEQEELLEEEDSKKIEASSQKSKIEQSNEYGFFQPAQEQRHSLVDFDVDGDMGNSFSQPNSFQQSSDTIKHMFDSMNANKFTYKSMSKRNLQIEIPETDYSGDEIATQEVIQHEEHNQHLSQQEDEQEEPHSHQEDELTEEEVQPDAEAQSEGSEYKEESSDDQQEENVEDVQENQSNESQQPTPKSLSKKSTPKGSSRDESEQEQQVEEQQDEDGESQKHSQTQIDLPKEISKSESLEDEIVAAENDEKEQSHKSDENEDDVEEVQIQEQEPIVGEECQKTELEQQKIHSSKSANSQSLNNSFDDIIKQKSISKQNSSSSVKQESRKSSVKIDSMKEPSQGTQEQQSQNDQQSDEPQIKEPDFEGNALSKHSSNHSFQQEQQEDQYEQSVRSPLNQLQSLHDLKDYSIEDYVAEQQDIEMRHKQLNNDMYNLLSHQKQTNHGGDDDYKSPKNNMEFLSSISERNAADEQFFYRDGTAHDSETHRDNMMIIGDDDMSSTGGNNFMQQQQQDNEDRYGNIGKWELEKKENEINEIESLDFSVKREEFPDQQYQSNTQNQPDDQIKSAEEQPRTEQMPIYNSPVKNIEEINLFNQKRDSKQSSTQVPRPPSSTETRQKSAQFAKPAKKQQVQEKKSIQKIKDLFNSEEKYQLYERLHSKETQSSQRKKRAFDQEDSAQKNSQLTFKPKIDAKSNILSTSQLDETKITQRAIDPCIFLYHKGVQLRKAKQEELKAQKEVKDGEQLKECTFMPNIIKRSVERTVPQSMYERNKYWNEQRKKKIEQEQQKIKDQELDGCSFTPQIQAHNLQQLRSARQDDDYQYDSMPMKSQRTSRSRNNKTNTQLQTLASERSVKVFIERQERAKQQKIEKNQVFLKNNGSNWKNEVTKPRPPKITDIIISNLQKKLTHKFTPQQDDQFKQQYSSRRKSKDVPIPRNMTQQHSREGSTLGGVDQDIMIFDDAAEVSTFKKPKQSQSNAEFKEQVKFLRQALHSLDLDQ